MIFQNMLLFTAIVGTVLALLTIAGVNIYDISLIKKQQQFNKQPHARRYRQRPLISIIIPTCNDERLIERTLASLVQSSHRKLEVIIVDRHSRDATKKLVKQFIAQYPRKKIRLSAKRTPVSAVQAVADVYRTYASGELILWLQPGQLLDRQALSAAVKHFNTEPGLDGLNCNHRVGTAYSTVSLFQRFELLLSYQFQKFNSISNTDYAATADGIIYRRAVLNQLLPKGSQKSSAAASPHPPMLRLGNRNIRLRYASDVVIYAAPLVSFYALAHERYLLQLRRLETLKSYRRLFFTRNSAYSKFLTWFRLPLAVCVGVAALCIPVLLTYFIYLAVRLHQPALYGISWALLTLFTVFAVWGDEHLKLHQKTGYSLLAPIVQGGFYLLSFVQIFVVLRSLLDSTRLFPLDGRRRFVSKV